ncbi:MAG TPA: hypothetical protein VMJ32_07825 [Pirellulales bacterium]|nr:hypothetical protein [Pirellulales bacterium]
MPDDRTRGCLGFLSIVEHEVHGLFGGYLLLNAVGQPLEFHCTAPVKPNRAQQILYGPTLEPYLYGEQIGATLLNATQRRPSVLFVEQVAALAVRQHIDVPTALVCATISLANSAAAGEAPIEVPGETPEFVIRQNHLRVAARFAADQALIVQRLTTLADLFDLCEPFERIRAAIDEAQRASAKAA